MTQEKRELMKKRKPIIDQIRAYLKEHLDPEEYQIQCQTIPCCKTCEFYFSTGNCAGGVSDDPEHKYGHKVTDEDDVCLAWGISYSAYCAGLAKCK